MLIFDATDDAHFDLEMPSDEAFLEIEREQLAVAYDTWWDGIGDKTFED